MILKKGINMEQFDKCLICGERHNPIAPAAYHKELIQKLKDDVKKLKTKNKQLKLKLKNNNTILFIGGNNL